jgi:hypothetical protein
MSLQTLISQANQRSEKGRKKVYVKKASDSQLLAQMVEAAARVSLAWRIVNKSGSDTGVFSDLNLAIRELDLLRDVIKKRTV